MTAYFDNLQGWLLDCRDAEDDDGAALRRRAASVLRGAFLLLPSDPYHAERTGWALMVERWDEAPEQVASLVVAIIEDKVRRDVRAVGLGLAALGGGEAAAVWRLLAAHPEPEDSAPEDPSDAGARVLRLCSDAHSVMHVLASAGWDDHPGRCAALLAERVRP